jgi:hypothetical protein
MDRDKLISDLGRKLIADIGTQIDNWAHLVMVGRFEDDEPAMNGFAYLSDGTSEPVAPMDFDILEILRDLRTAMASADRKEPWVQALFRIDRSSKELDGEFEYDNPERWTITLKNTKERAEELRPSSLSAKN